MPFTISCLSRCKLDFCQVMWTTNKTIFVINDNENTIWSTQPYKRYTKQSLDCKIPLAALLTINACWLPLLAKLLIHLNRVCTSQKSGR